MTWLLTVEGSWRHLWAREEVVEGERSGVDY